MADPKELAQQLETHVIGTTEWRVANPKTGDFCISFSRRESLHPEAAAREWLRDHRQRFPASPFANYEVREVTYYNALEQVALQAADYLNGIAGVKACLHRPSEDCPNEAACASPDGCLRLWPRDGNPAGPSPLPKDKPGMYGTAGVVVQAQPSIPAGSLPGGAPVVHASQPCVCGAGTMGDCMANTCAKVQAAAGVVAWMHEFKDPHTSKRTRQASIGRPKEYELQPGDTVRPLVYATVGVTGILKEPDHG